jgi:hypothetical protein
MAEKSGPRPDWRNRNAAGQSSAAGGRDWRGDKQAAAGAARQSHRTTIIAVLAVLLVLAAAAFVKVVLFPDLAKPVCLALLGAGYEENLALPHNAYGMLGLKELDAAGANTHLLGLRHVKNLISKQVWDEEWGKIQKESQEDTLVLFLALHGMADDSDAYLLFDDAAGGTKLPLSELLSNLGNLNKKVLLILEPALAGAYWPAGIVHNDFVARLKDPKTVLGKNLVVLCASDEGQTSWVSEERGQTIFNYFLIKGLRDKALISGSNRISVGDLYEYVKENVANWAWHNRAAVQTPILLGSAETRNGLELIPLTSNADDPEADKATESPSKLFVPSAPLKGLWAQTAKLALAMPAPAVYTPQRWRFYLDMGVRYEQLERAGYPAADLARLKGVLDESAARMRNEARCDEAAACLGWTLPMHGVLGFRAPLDEKKAEAGLHDLQLELAGDGKNRNKVFAALAKQVPGDFAEGDTAAKKLVRGQLHRALLSKIESEIDPQHLEATWQEVRKLVDFIDDGDRPAETHLLVMLLQDLDRKHSPSAELLKKALAVRRQAEEAALAPAHLRTHPYSEAVFTRVRLAIDEADRLRRTGEDWLFASSTKDHERGNADLTKAAEGFRQAQSQAAILRAALDMRDRGLADLPYFAWWVAIQREPRQDLARWENQTKELAKNLKDIAADLDDPKKLDHLAEATTKARLAHAELGKALRKELVSLEKPLDEQEHWHQTEAALALPIGLGAAETFDAVKNRETLFTNSRRMSGLWNAQQSRPRDVAAGAKPVQKKDRQEAMVSAALQPYEVLPDRRVPAVEDVRAAMAPSNEEENRLKNGLSKLDRVAACDDLRRVDFLWRRLPVTRRMLGQADEASRVLRGLRLVDLLVWQAERTGRDHWFVEEKTAEYPGVLGKPYYQTAAQAYLDAAKQLARQWIANRKQQDAMVTMLANKSATFDMPNALHQQQGPNLLWTGVQDHTLQWKIAKDEGSYLEPFGVPVAWLAQPQGAKVIGAQTGRATFVPYERLTLEALGPPKNAKEETLEFKLARAREDEALPKGKGEFVVLYRGAKLRKPVTLEARAPDLIVRNELPLKAPEVAVQAKASNAAVCIMLDCSPSMLSKSKHGGITKERFKWATEALSQALENIPEGTWLSVRAMMNSSKREIRSPREWEAGQRDRLIQEIAELEARIDKKTGASPIADALVDAKDNGFRREWRGLKVVVGLTDGDDNESGLVRKQDMPAYDPNNPGPYYRANTAFVQRLMKEEFNQKENYEVHIICFIDPNKSSDEEEAKRAYEQFSGVADFEPLPGTFRREPDGKKLADGLAAAIRPKLYLHRGGKIKKISATYPREGYRFEPIAPDVSYTPGFAERLKQQPLIAAKGDKLLIEIVAGGLRRALVTDKVRERQQIGKIISVPEHRWDKDGRLHQLITIEDPDTKVLEHRRPAFVWIDTAPAPGKPPTLVQWQPAYYHTAPAYKLEAVTWPSDRQEGTVVAAPAQTRVWWSADAPAGPMLKRVPIALGDSKQVIIGGAEVQVDVIERSLPIKPGDPSTKCLEVRLSHPPNKRFRVEIEPQLLAEEHRYFTADGHLTALFWIENGRVPSELRIVDVSAFLNTLSPVTFNLAGVRSDSLLGE